MNYSELIHDFVDGNLDAAQEDELFLMLSGNEELRNELKDFIKIEKAFTKNLGTFAPSSSATIGLMSKLGIGAASGAIISNTIVNQPVSRSFLATHSKVIISGFVSAVATFLIFFGIYSDKILNDKTSDRNLNTSSSIVQKNEPAKIYSIEGNGLNKDNIPLSSTKREYTINIKNNDASRNTQAINDFKEVQDNVVSSNESEMQSADVEPAQTEDNNLVSYNEEATTRHYPSLQPANNYTHKPGVVSRPGSSFVFPDQVSYSDGSLFDSKIGLFVELRSAQYWQATQPDIEQSSIPLFYNGGIAVFYVLNEDFKVGLDVRNEHYYQKFQGTDEDGNHYEYTQYPNYTSWGISGRWNLLSYDFINAFSQLSLGGTQTGGVGRIVLGSEFHASPTVKFIISFEGSTLAYKHQNSIYFSPKFGINYGVGLNF